jgi:hypothetical protein
MADHIYRVVELAGSSEIGHADALERAIARVSEMARNRRWFEVTQMRGEIEDGKVRHCQVMMKVGFTQGGLRSITQGDPPREIA